MSKYIIEGGHKLQGRVKVSGNKNSVLPCMAAALLTDGEVTLKNVPDISDVAVFADILRFLGAKVEISKDTVTINCCQNGKTSLPAELVDKLRASILLIGPLLATQGKIEFSHPGGDLIGMRGINVHLAGFKELGFAFEVGDKKYKGWREKEVNFTEIFLEEASVTATENLLLASAIGKTNVVLKNCAKEPHIVDLCNLLVKMGAQISGIGESTLTVSGSNALHGVEFEIGSDYAEFGAYAIACAITDGEVEIEGCRIKELLPIIRPLQKMGINFQENGELIKVSAKTLCAIPKLITNIWPGFPTDLMSTVIVLATQAKGVSLLHDWMYESRMFFVDKLIDMGAHITIADPHRVLVYGPAKLYGRNLASPDIRAGMALVLAALIAEDESTINRAEIIERGYEKIAEKLTKLGAKIQRLD